MSGVSQDSLLIPLFCNILLDSLIFAILPARILAYNITVFAKCKVTESAVFRSEEAVCLEF